MLWHAKPCVEFSSNLQRMQIINTLPYAHPKYVTGETLLWGCRDASSIPNPTAFKSGEAETNGGTCRGQLDSDTKAFVWKVPEAHNALE
jgi:hypothetical protein